MATSPFHKLSARKSRMRGAFRNRRKADFANIAEGSAGTGNKSYLPDAAMANRFNLVVIGSSQNNITPSAGQFRHPAGCVHGTRRIRRCLMCR